MGGGENREVIVYVRVRRRQSRGERRSRRERGREGGTEELTGFSGEK